MKNLIKKLPLPISGLMLGLAGLGNLLASYGEVFRNLCGILSALIFIMLVAKMVFMPREVVKELDNHVVLSVFPTFTMGMMLLSTYVNPFSHFLAYGLWILSIILHALLIVVFTKRHILNFDIKKVLPTYFIVYVGIVMASVTAPIYDSHVLGQAIFYFGLIAYLILLPIVIYRVFFIKNIAEPVLPTMSIFAAPASLCLAGYVSAFADKSLTMIGFLLTLSLVMLLAVILYLPKMLKIKFYPSYSAFTFPLVISAVAVKLTNGFLVKSGFSITGLKYLVKFEEILAGLVVFYVLYRYLAFLSTALAQAENIQQKPVQNLK